jgi:dATP pyrophosphohydrolase
MVARVEDVAPSLLFLRRAGGRFDRQWWPVTGTLKPNESPLAGALRELAEETGLTPDAVYDTRLCAPETNSRGILQVVVAIVSRGVQVTLNWEHDAYQWCSLSEAQALIPGVAHPPLAEAERIARTRPPERQIFPPLPDPAA